MTRRLPFESMGYILKHQSSPNPEALCRICGLSSKPFGSLQVLHRYTVQYFLCSACGFMQTEAPYWLDEAYSSAISKQDVGVLERNLFNREATCAVLSLLYPSIKQAIDFGGGHGIFTRLMRDRGFEFLWYDTHASNDYARGFEHVEGNTYDFLTAFEVLEHLVNPIADLSLMMNLSQNVFVSTLLVPQPVPQLSDWWYYLPSTGQHISFYSLDSLRVIARRFGRHLLSHGPYHLFTIAPQSNLLFRLCFRMKVARTINFCRKRHSLVEPDFTLMTK
jgi:hypothetical protein